MYVPTWIDMLLLLVAFIVIGIQHRGLTPRYGPILNIRFGMLVVCCALMLLTIFLNKHADWTSVGLFLAALACLIVAWRLQRLMPLKRQD
jgi:hypothetical protein